MRTLMLTLLLTSCGGGRTLQPQRSASECFTETTTWLADDARQGRGVGSEGLAAAATYIEGRFRDMGLSDGGVAYRQPFRATTGVALGPDNRLAVGPQDLTVGEDFTPLGFSSSVAFEGELIFAGYGIVAKPLDYDDYRDVDVTGKVVLALRYEPGETDAGSPFDGKRPSRFSDLRYKALKAREHGAAALIFVTGPAGASPGEEERLPALKSDGPISVAGLPVLQVTRARASAWLEQAGMDLLALQTQIDTTYKPASRPTALRVTGQTAVEKTTAPVENIVGVLPGSGALRQETVIVGAHYDHLGHGGRGSMEPDSDAIHNGADDNASGTAAMICAVQELARVQPKGDRRTLVAIAFTAEEIGLGGSGWYARNPIFPLEDTLAMVNLDMVGRVRNNALQAMGTDSATEWVDLFGSLQTDLDVVTGGDGYGPSDHMSFYEQGIPVVHLFSGAHEEYHTPRDDVGTLNTEGAVQVQELLVQLLDRLAHRPEKMTFQRASSAPAMSGDSRGYGSYLGTIPDYTAMSETEGGVLLSDVRSGGPADRAGIQGGDRIVGMAGVTIQNLYDMTFVLRDHKPLETIEVIVLRDGARHTLSATLGKRAAQPDGAAHGTPWKPTAGEAVDHLLDPRETHLSELRQLTFDGENAEAYFSPDGKKLIFQRTGPIGGCDQQYVYDLSTSETARVSSGKGRTTCGYFDYPAGERLIYATTEAGNPACPPPPDHSMGYVWALYPDFDLVWQRPGEDPEPFLARPGYDAEATVCFESGEVLFTSTRSGDLELYKVDGDGENLVQLTDTPGYDGGAFFSPDCEHIVWRASRPEGAALEDYRGLLERDLVKPSALEIFWMKSDGTDVRQLTDNGKANFGPYPLPEDAGVIFSSNSGASAREFDLYLVGLDGGAPEQVTYTEGFDGFPMISPNGQTLVFASNRANPKSRQTNLYIARWSP